MVGACGICGKPAEESEKRKEGMPLFCSNRCRVRAYDDWHQRTDWLMLRVLAAAYQQIRAAGLNFELSVDMGEYPGRDGMRPEYKEFGAWVRRFVKQESTNGVASEETEEEVDTESLGIQE